MSYILEGLYLGSLTEACETRELEKKGITHILTIDGRPLASDYHSGFVYKCILALDMETTDLLVHFDECLAFIGSGREQGGVLVHCYAGQSRSATVVLAYLMQSLCLSLEDATNLVRRQRPQIRPNPGFQEQLELFESMGNQVNKHDSIYKVYRLKNVANKMQKASTGRDILHDVFSADPSIKHQPGSVVYKCKKCRRPLFRQTSLLPHDRGIGDAAFDWRSKTSASDSLEQTNNVCKSSLFIEPVQWMSDDIYEIEGKLSCPKCRAKLGSFNWIGERCPCGTWVIPAFHIQSNKVDKCLPSVTMPTNRLNKPLIDGQLCAKIGIHNGHKMMPEREKHSHSLTFMKSAGWSQSSEATSNEGLH